MSNTPSRADGARHLELVDVPLERDDFVRTLLRHLTGTLQDIVGLDEAATFVALVGQRMGDDLNGAYREALGAHTLDREDVADVLVDLKRRIGGDFFVVEQSDERIVLGNRRCPFEAHVVGRPSLCMMTSNVFGTIAAENLGYAKVTLEQSIARGDPGCRVVVNLRPAPAVEGREYVRK